MSPTDQTNNTSSTNSILARPQSLYYGTTQASITAADRAWPQQHAQYYQHPHRAQTAPISGLNRSRSSGNLPPSLVPGFAPSLYRVPDNILDFSNRERAMTVSVSPSICPEPPLPPRPPEREPSELYSQLKSKSTHKVQQPIVPLLKSELPVVEDDNEEISALHPLTSTSSSTSEPDYLLRKVYVGPSVSRCEKLGGRSFADSKVSDDASLALAMSDLFKNEKARADEQERLDLEFARKLQAQEDQAVGSSQLASNRVSDDSCPPAFPAPSHPPPTYFPSPESNSNFSIASDQTVPLNAVAHSLDLTESVESSHPDLKRTYTATSTTDDASSRLQSENGHAGSLIDMQSRIDPELLRAVSFGFGPPPLLRGYEPMVGSIPNLITLHSEPSPPFHLQARSWRCLLRLLARLDSSRIEITTEAFSILKETPKLRTVIQFNRVAQSTWRIVLYLTVDYEGESSVRQQYKYTNGDTTTVPFSYTLCNPPLLFHNNEITQFYTVPSTTASPYPSLPITLPNYALYLQSVLQDSRQAANDVSGGSRRLAKMLDTYFREEMNRNVEDEGSGKMRRLLGALRKPKTRGRTGNEEVYDLVTPFRLDEWG